MYRQPVNTGERPTTHQTFCSALAKKLCIRLPTNRAEGKQGYPPKLEEAKTDDDKEKKKENKICSECNEIKSALKKIKRTTPFLTKALQSPEAYKKGEKECETCGLDKETYRSIMKSVKVIEVIVDNAIDSEQKEMLDKEDQKQDNKGSEKKEKVGPKVQNKITVQFEVFCQKNNDDHNLKCALVKLQKVIGETLLQICFCKSKKDTADDEKCKLFNVSINLLEQLKFEYTYLTNKIIQLFKRPPTNQKTLPEICVACKKEELSECAKLLEEILKTGRNLKVTMRNEDVKEGQCCSRSYPHVHAIVQDRPVVLKFSLPFEVAPPSQSQRDSKSKSLKRRYESSPAYDEWPKHFTPGPGDESSTSRSTDKLLQSLQEEPSINKKPSIQRDPTEETPTSKDIPLGNKLRDRSSSASIKSVKSSKVRSSHDSKPSEKGPSHESLKKSATISEVELSTQGSTISDSGPSATSIPPKLESSHSKREFIYSLRYCGCNFDEVYKNINEDQKTNQNSDLQEKQSKENTISYISESLESTDSFSMINHQKKVSFQGNKQAVYTTVINQSQSLFMNQQSQFDQPPDTYRMEDLLIEELGEPPVTTVDSRMLVQNKYSLTEKSKPAQEHRQNKTTAKPFVNPLQYEIKQTPQTVQTTTNMQRKSSRILNKDQVGEVLKDLSATQLLSISFPAECCKNNKLVKDFNSASDLPFSASLHSLPLDQDDLNHITKAVEKLISNEDIMLIPDYDNEWEIQYVEDLDDGKETKPEWHKAFSARDTASNICIEIQTDKPVSRKKFSKNLTERDDPKTLPTIDEEEIVIREKPSTASYSKGKVEKQDNLIKEKSISKLKTTELRYLTVEYTNISGKSNTSNRMYDCRQMRTVANDYSPLDPYFKINQESNNLKTNKNVNKVQIGDSSFNPNWSQITRHQTELPTVDCNNTFSCSQKCKLSAVDEMIMDNAIYFSTSNTATDKMRRAVNSENNLSPSDVQMFKHISSYGLFSTETAKQRNYKTTTLPTSYQSQMQETQLQQLLPHHKERNVQGSTKTVLYNLAKDYKVCNNNILLIDTNHESDLKPYSQLGNDFEKLDHEKVEETTFNNKLQESLNCFESERNDEGKVIRNNFVLVEKVGYNEVKANKSCPFITIKHNCKSNETKTLTVSNDSSPDMVSHYDKEESDKQKLVGNKFSLVNRFCDVKDYEFKGKSEGALEHLDQFCQKPDTSNKNTAVQDTIDQRTLKHSIPDFNHSRKEDKADLRLHSLNLRSDLICKKPWSKISPDLRRKPLTLTNTTVGYRSKICKIKKPELQFAKITPVVLHQGIPMIMIKPKNHSQHEEEHPKNSFGMDNSYISVKYTSKSESGKVLKTIKSSLKYLLPQENSVSETKSDLNHKNSNSLINIEKAPVPVCSNISGKLLRGVNNEIKEMNSTDKESNPLSLFNVKSQPQSEKPLWNVNGESLLVIDEAGPPMCDANNDPILDKDLGLTYSSCSQILKIQTSAGDGRPLTSDSRGASAFWL